jgi:hypothetical protein
MLKRFIKLTAVLLVVVVAAVGISRVPVSAEDSTDSTKPAGSMTLSPVRGKEKLEPGKRYSGSFTISNTGTMPFDFRVYVKPFAIGVDCVDRYEESNDFNMMTRWVNFDQNNYYGIQPDQVQTVNFHIDVPKDAPAGGQYVVIFAEQGDFDPNSGAAIGVNKRIGYKFYADLGGTNVTAGKVESVNQKGLFWNPPIVSSSHVRNTGNIDFVEKHTITITGLNGEEVYTKSQELTVLPDTCRKIEHKWDGTPSFGIFWVENRIEFLDKEQFSEKRLVIVLPIYIVVIFGIMIALLIWALVVKLRDGRVKLSSKKGHRKTP